MTKLVTLSLSLMSIVAIGSAQMRTPQSLTDAQVAALIEQVKQMPASRLDSGLSRASFAKWLQTQVGAGAKISWVMRYVEPVAMADGGRDFPTCVEVDARMDDGRSITILIGVGRTGRVGDRKPFVYRTDLMDQHDSISLNHLSDIPAALRKAQQTESHPEMAR